MDYGKITETLVYQHLKSQFRQDIFYWKTKQEVDFVVRSGNDTCSAIQVAYDNLDDPITLQRESLSLDQSQVQFPKAEAKLIAGRVPKTSN